MKSMLITAENGSKIHNNLKTMTRRCHGLEAVNIYPDNWVINSKLRREDGSFALYAVSGFETTYVDPRYQVGDLVAIREPHYVWGFWFYAWIDSKNRMGWQFKPDLDKFVFFPDNLPPNAKVLTGRQAEFGWYLRPGMFMFAQHVRSHVRITEVICQRLQDITPEDCIAEGVKTFEGDIWWAKPKGQFELLWDSINGKHKKDKLDLSWAANPWDFGYRFKRI